MDIQKIVQEVMQEMGTQQAGAPQAYCPQGFEVPAHLEHSLLNPDMTEEKLLEECLVARRCCVAAVCVAPYYVSAAAQALRGSGVAVCAAIGFPHGAMSGAAKIAEARECIRNGATELDVAVNILAVKSGHMADARAELEQVMDIARGKAKVKAVFEHSVYTDSEKAAVLHMAKGCGVEFVKIQNVLSGKGAEAEDICYAKNILGSNVDIKIDGGVKTLEQAMTLLDAGAQRIGLTATKAVSQQALQKR
ncbi:MAG: deoxyribose-phosphate aldolase [Christensenella sp.]|uniref:deoxyribose-phosphate aldolase n=1 Tax=Christensenella sp. TaxID=1935934 RepID=UPI002B21AA7D|nr:deoxyribose-phosphate aldolase [Christensenella sp.]MEA5003729.1 deoxyribose-phosphate aldolase [Christensenella sp.]